MTQLCLWKFSIKFAEDLSLKVNFESSIEIVRDADIGRQILIEQYFW